MPKFNLSKTAIAAIDEKAALFKTSRIKALEWMIMEYTPSSESEKKEQKKRRTKAKYDYFDDVLMPAYKYGRSDMIAAWNAGYNAGWGHFQTRKTQSRILADE